MGRSHGSSRRAFVRSTLLAGAAVLAGCSGNAARVAALRDKARKLGASLECSDVSSLQPAEASTRVDNTYRQHTDRDDQFCLAWVEAPRTHRRHGAGRRSDRRPGLERRRQRRQQHGERITPL